MLKKLNLITLHASLHVQFIKHNPNFGTCVNIFVLFPVFVDVRTRLKA